MTQAVTAHAVNLDSPAALSEKESWAAYGSVNTLASPVFGASASQTLEGLDQSERPELIQRRHALLRVCEDYVQACASAHKRGVSKQGINTGLSRPMVMAALGEEQRGYGQARNIEVSPTLFCGVDTLYCEVIGTFMRAIETLEPMDLERATRLGAIYHHVAGDERKQEARIPDNTVFWLPVASGNLAAEDVEAVRRDRALTGVTEGRKPFVFWIAHEQSGTAVAFVPATAADGQDAIVDAIGNAVPMKGRVQADPVVAAHKGGGANRQR